MTHKIDNFLILFTNLCLEWLGLCVSECSEIAKAAELKCRTHLGLREILWDSEKILGNFPLTSGTQRKFWVIFH
jgi:hypothetical protein